MQFQQRPIYRRARVHVGKKRNPRRGGGDWRGAWLPDGSPKVDHFSPQGRLLVFVRGFLGYGQVGAFIGRP